MCCGPKVIITFNIQLLSWSVEFLSVFLLHEQINNVICNQNTEKAQSEYNNDVANCVHYTCLCTMQDIFKMTLFEYVEDPSTNKKVAWHLSTVKFIDYCHLLLFHASCEVAAEVETTLSLDSRFSRRSLAVA